jgi:pilus assembly protein Flp/PilA
MGDKTMLNKLFTIKSQKGAAMIEYALLAALIAVVAMAGVGPLGTAVKDAFDTIAAAL